MTAPKLDADLLATLSPEEREAIAGADPDEINALKSVAGGSDDTPAKADAKAGAKAEEGAAADDADDDGEDADDADADDDEAAAAPAPAPAAAAPAPAAEPEPAAAAADGVVVDEIPPPRVRVHPLPDDYEERSKAVEAARSDIYARLQAGELTIDELPAEMAKVDKEASELQAIRIRHETSADRAKEAMDEWRQRVIDTTLDRAATPAGGGIDYRKDAAAAKELDLFAKALAADERNADKPLTWFLDQAHRRVMALRGLSPAPAASPAPAPAPAAAKPAARKPAMSEVPATLAAIPGGDGPGDVGGEFDDILNLTGEDYEAAIARMAATDKARWARFQRSQH